MPQSPGPPRAAMTREHRHVDGGHGATASTPEGRDWGGARVTRPGWAELDPVTPAKWLTTAAATPAGSTGLAAREHPMRGLQAEATCWGPRLSMKMLPAPTVA